MSNGGWVSAPVAECLVPVSFAGKTKIQTKDYKTAGRFPIIDQGQEQIAAWTDDRSAVIDTPLPLIIFGDHTRAFKFADVPFARGADGTQLLKPKPEIDPLFFFYACRAIDLPGRGYNRHFSILKEKHISYPIDNAEQRMIGTTLRKVETGLSHQVTLLKTLQHLKHAAMRDLFSRGLRHEAQKQTEIGMVPESWSVVEFGSVREWLQYGTSTRCTYEPTELPVLRIPNIEPGRVNAQDIKFGTLSTAEANRYRLKDGDVIFIRTNGVIERLGTTAVYAGQPQGALFASYLIRARLKLDRINPYFIAHFFGSELGTRIVAGRATPAADGKYNLNTGTIDSLPIPLPPTLHEQQDIINVLDAVDRKIDLHQRKRTVLDDLFKALLHKLMTGGIGVADLDLSALPNPLAEAAA